MITRFETEIEIPSPTEHEGEFVALDRARNAIAYGETEDELEARLLELGLKLHDVVVSRIPQFEENCILLPKESAAQFHES